MAGSLVGQGALLAVSPILTRVYSPADFGALAVFTSIATVLGGLATLSWERAIVIPRSELQANAVVWLGVLTTLGFAAILAPSALVCGPYLDRTFGTAVFTLYWWLLPVTVLGMGLYAVMSSWLVRARRYGSLAGRNVIQGLSQAVSTVALGVLGVGVFGLISSIAIGRFSSVVGTVRWKALPHSARPSRARMIIAAKRFRKFPLVATWSRTLNTLGLQLPPILIVGLYGSAEAGLYALTLRVLAAPVGIVVNAVSQYFDGAFSARLRSRSGGLVSLISTLAGRLILVSALPAALVILFAPALFSWTFGAEWELAGVFAQITIYYYILQFAVSPVSRALLVLERQGTQLAWDVARALAAVLAVTVPVAYGGSLAVALVALTTVQSLLYVTLYVLCIRAARHAELAW